MSKILNEASDCCSETDKVLPDNTLLRRSQRLVEKQLSQKAPTYFEWQSPQLFTEFDDWSDRFLMNLTQDKILQESEIKKDKKKRSANVKAVSKQNTECKRKRAKIKNVHKKNIINEKSSTPKREVNAKFSSALHKQNVFTENVKKPKRSTAECATQKAAAYKKKTKLSNFRTKRIRMAATQLSVCPDNLNQNVKAAKFERAATTSATTQLVKNVDNIKTEQLLVNQTRPHPFIERYNAYSLDNQYNMTMPSGSILPAVYPAHFINQLPPSPENDLHTIQREQNLFRNQLIAQAKANLKHVSQHPQENKNKQKATKLDDEIFINSPSSHDLSRTPSLSDSLHEVFGTNSLRDVLNIEPIKYRLTEEQVAAAAIILNIETARLRTTLNLVQKMPVDQILKFAAEISETKPNVIIEHKIQVDGNQEQTQS